MIQKVAHIGIAVKDIVQIRHLYMDLLGLQSTDEGQNEEMRWAFFTVGETALEFMEPTAPGAVIAKFLERKGEGVHHIALETDNIDRELERLKTAGVDLVDKIPKPGAHGSRIAFLHPKSSNGVLLELVESARPKRS